MADTLPNGHRAVAGTERVVLWSSIIVIILASVVSYVRTTSDLNADLDRNCRILVRIEQKQDFLSLIHTDSPRAAQNFLDTSRSLPNEICG